MSVRILYKTCIYMYVHIHKYFYANERTHTYIDTEVQKIHTCIFTQFNYKKKFSDATKKHFKTS